MVIVLFYLRLDLVLDLRPPLGFAIPSRRMVAALLSGNALYTFAISVILLLIEI